ncbi:MAG: hypothetical protein K6T57_15670 [Thermaceae bacterium]|nr:hypothetical protein [Thermaceae bacterium]
MRSFIDSLFNGPTQLLQQAIAFLQGLALTASHGINVSDYVSWIGLLDPAFSRVVNSLFAAVLLLGILYIVRAVYRAYLSLKSGIKWW